MARSLASRIRAANETLLVAGELDAIPEYFTPSYAAHGTRRDLTGGHAAVRRYLATLLRAFPELDVEVEVLVQARGRVAWHRTLRGVQRGPYRGFPATGRRVLWRDMIVSRFEAGRFAEDWVITDLAEALLRARKR